MKILVVDDSKVMRMIVKRHIRQAGFGHYTVEQAGDGAEALDLVRAGAPDIVISDWNMPQMNGIELLENLRAEGNAVPFGFVTSEGSADMRKRAADTGALFVITKPFTVDHFKDALSKVLQ